MLTVRLFRVHGVRAFAVRARATPGVDDCRYITTYVVILDSRELDDLHDISPCLPQAHQPPMKPPTPKEQGMGPNSHRRRTRPRSRGRVTHRGARVTIPAPYGRVTVQSAAPSSFHASASIPSHISCRCISLYLVVSRCISIFVVSRCLVFLSSLYVAMFLVLLGLTLSLLVSWKSLSQ